MRSAWEAPSVKLLAKIRGNMGNNFTFDVEGTHD